MTHPEQRIIDFIGEHHILTMAIARDNVPWCATCYYAYLVNLNRIKEVVPWFKSSYQLRMDDKKHTEIPVSRVQTRRLRELFKL